MHIKRKKFFHYTLYQNPSFLISFESPFWSKSMRSFICFPTFLCGLLCHNSSIAFTETISMNFFFETDKIENSMRCYITSCGNTLQ